MTRLFAGYSMCLKALILLGFSAQFTVLSANADAGPTLLSIPTQTIVAGQPFSYRIVVGSDADQPVGVKLINAPKGARLTDNADGSHEFWWTPPADVGEQTVIIVQAFNIAQPNLISTQRVVLQRGSAEQRAAAASTPVTSASASVVVASNNAIGSRFVTPQDEATSVATSVATSEATGASADSTSAVTTSTPTKVVADVSSAAPKGYTSKFKTKPSVGVEANEKQSALLSRSTESDSAAVSRITAASNAEQAPKAALLTSQRPELPELGLQRLTVGKEFQFFIRPVDAGDAQVQLSAESLPVGATFEDVFEGNKMLRWTPTADQLGRHKMSLVLVAEDAANVSLRTERELLFVVDPAPPLELEPELSFEPMSAQIVSAGRRVNFRVEPKASDDKIALLQVDRLPAGGSFDENKDGTRTFHWPTTQADQGEHTFRFTAIHPENTELIANVNVLIVVGSPDGPASGPSSGSSSGPSSAVSLESPPPAPEPDDYPSADSPSPAAALPSPESPSSVDSPSPEPYPSADTASPEPLAVKPPPQPRPTPD